MFCQFLGSLEAVRVVAEGLLDGERVVVRDMEGEVDRFSVEGWVAGNAAGLRVVENDIIFLVGEVSVEPGETATGEFYGAGTDDLDGRIG